MKILKGTTRALILLILSIAFLISCSKDDPTPETATASTTPVFEGTAGVLWAVRTVTEVNTGINIGGAAITMEIGTAVGVFMDGGNSVDVGTVSMNGTNLDKYSNNYVSTVSVTQPTGLDFSKGIKWAITGGSGFAAFNHTVTNSFPSVGTFSPPAELTQANGYTLGFSSVSGADSIIYSVNDVSKTVAGNVKSYTFTAAQLSKLSKGPAIVQAVPYNYKIATYGGKQIVFGNELVYTKTININ